MFDESENIVSGIFECNICLDSVQEPVVTFCGHLYCWPCIYRWIKHQQTSSNTFENQNAMCPVCKTEVSEKTVVPLYGPNQSTNNENKEKEVIVDLVVPPRPQTSRNHGYQRLEPPRVTISGGRRDMSTDCLVVHSPTIGMIGEILSGRLLRNMESPLFGTLNSYNEVGNRTQRERWQMTQVDAALSRIFILSCCSMIFYLCMFT
ncbi:E3 ubiquitin-protein ligase RMA1H1-like [Rutidosis leptorrhynchoides]|uniref:E3 ubiquitin-protein ligase RMA1H1-like n=1 Tax=Rutidosis leptorrhynchoides TaxID=125765 RepID=UPI003A993F9B